MFSDTFKKVGILVIAVAVVLGFVSAGLSSCSRASAEPVAQVSTR